MGKYKFGKSSINNIHTVTSLLQELAARAIEVSEVDFGVLSTGGLRTPEEQNEIFKIGNSKCDGYKKKSYHQTGFAIDFVPYVDGKYTWNNVEALLRTKQAVDKAWKDILHGNHFLHWGGYWGAKDLDGDGRLEITDRIGWDAAHYELRSYPQVKNVYNIYTYTHV